MEQEHEKNSEPNFHQSGSSFLHYDLRLPPSIPPLSSSSSSPSHGGPCLGSEHPSEPPPSAAGWTGTAADWAPCPDPRWTCGTSPPRWVCTQTPPCSPPDEVKQQICPDCFSGHGGHWMQWRCQTRTYASLQTDGNESSNRFSGCFRFFPFCTYDSICKIFVFTSLGLKKTLWLQHFQHFF